MDTSRGGGINFFTKMRGIKHFRYSGRTGNFLREVEVEWPALVAGEMRDSVKVSLAIFVKVIYAVTRVSSRAVADVNFDHSQIQWQGPWPRHLGVLRSKTARALCRRLALRIHRSPHSAPRYHVPH